MHPISIARSVSLINPVVRCVVSPALRISDYSQLCGKAMRKDENKFFKIHERYSLLPAPIAEKLVMKMHIFCPSKCLNNWHFHITILIFGRNFFAVCTRNMLCVLYYTYTPMFFFFFNEYLIVGKQIKWQTRERKRERYKWFSNKTMYIRFIAFDSSEAGFRCKYSVFLNHLCCEPNTHFIYLWLSFCHTRACPAEESFGRKCRHNRARAHVNT